jgi:hypothetical protein
MGSHIGKTFQFFVRGFQFRSAFNDTLFQNGIKPANFSLSVFTVGNVVGNRIGDSFVRIW